jgi:hypothetical protein
MKKFLLSFLFILISYGFQAQINLSVGRTMPRGNFGKLFKPSTLIEVGYSYELVEDKFKIGVSIGYMNVNPKLDTFNTYGFVSSSNFTGVTSGYEIYEDFYSIPLSLKFDYRLNYNKLSPVFGFDIYAFYNSYTYVNVTDRISEEYTQESNTYLGAQIRAGANYKVNDYFSLEIGLGRTSTLNQGEGLFIFWKPFLVFNYNI